MAKGKYTEWINEDGLIRIAGWARDGLTDEQIAKNMGVSSATFYKWKNKYVELVEALKKAKDVVDRQVENALLKNALGYEYEEITTEIDSTGKKHIKKIKRLKQPDTVAQIFWLKNRKRDTWRDRPDNSLASKKKSQELINLELEAKKLEAEIEKLTGYGEELEYVEDIETEIYGNSNQEKKDNTV